MRLGFRLVLLLGIVVGFEGPRDALSAKESDALMHWSLRAEMRLIAERIVSSFKSDHPQSLEHLKLLANHMSALEVKLLSLIAQEKVSPQDAEKLDFILWNRLREVGLYPHYRMDRKHRVLWLKSLLLGDLDKRLIDEEGAVSSLMRSLRMNSILEALDELQENEPQADQSDELAPQDLDDDVDEQSFLEITPKGVPRDPHFLMQFFPKPKPLSVIYLLAPQNLTAALITESLERSLGNQIEALIESDSTLVHSVANKASTPIPVFEIRHLSSETRGREMEHVLEFSILIPKEIDDYSVAPGSPGKLYQLELRVKSSVELTMILKNFDTDLVAAEFMKDRNFCRRLIARRLAP